MPDEEKTFLWLVKRMQRWDECEVQASIPQPNIDLSRMGGIGFLAVFEDYAAAVEYAGGKHELVQCMVMTPA